MSAVFDSSAVLAIAFDERGAGVAIAEARRAVISSVNMVEVLEKAEQQAVAADRVLSLLRRLEIGIVPYTTEHAVVAASLRPAARRLNISLADLACLSLALVRKVPVVTADQDWIKLRLDLDIRLIR